VLAPQKYDADVDDTNLSGQFTAAYKATSKVNAYATFSTSFKSVGLNLNGVPTDALAIPSCRRPPSSRKT
jgi:iron complex outermembrane receptor protein